MSDAQGALCHLTLQYIDWLALQLLPDTAETEWLDRHGKIWLVNADGSTGRKVATFSAGTVEFTGMFGIVVPIATPLSATIPGTNNSVSVGFETTEQITIGNAPTACTVRALDAGAVGNLPTGTALGVVIDGVDSCTVVNITGGVDTENDENLRARVLTRIQQPPQGGAAHDYLNWALAVPGVTRAWVAPNEMGIGTVTVRVMMDELRADEDGFPRATDLAAVQLYMDKMRPVAVKDMFVLAPLRQPVDVYVKALMPDTPGIRAACEQSIRDMLYDRAAPGQTIYSAWKYYALMDTAGVDSFILTNSLDDVMPSPGHMAVLGDISFF
jgi:uncharacterized phage protein gp47/JayE